MSNKRLGQHFLKNKSAIQKIIAALNLQTDDTIIEIGPGKGALTLPLAENSQFPIPNYQLLAIEKDKELAKALEQKIKTRNLNNITVIEGDALKELPKLINDWKLEIGNWKLIGNIPYYITGKLLRVMGDLDPLPQKIVLMIQKEVAERISAKEGKMNLLAAAVQFWAEPKILFSLKPEDFDPEPKVKSAVIELTKKKEMDMSIKEKYYDLIKVIFKQPRKTLSNNLKNGTNLNREKIESAINSVKLPKSCRPQDLSPEKIKKLAHIIQY